jgi:hypothetical protein
MLSGRQKSAGEIPSWRGEIVAIVIIIAPDFIGIIITIILITSNFIFTIGMMIVRKLLKLLRRL